jgi:cephalosporin hydroxylase
LTPSKNEEQLVGAFRTMEGLLASLRLASRPPETSGGARYVRIEDRTWMSDLPLSDRFLETVQQAKASRLRWRGAALVKDPFDMAIIPQLLAELQPRTVIELGAYQGGSAVWLADNLDLLGIDGHVLSFELDLSRVKVRHPRVTFFQSDLTNLATLASAGFGPARMGDLPHPWLVIEDAHVNTYEVLCHFDARMQAGDYVIAEDLLSRRKYMEVHRFARERDYWVDTAWTDLFGYNVTWNPNGYLRKQ